MNSTKTVVTTVGIVGAALIFTPLAPVGAVLGIGAGVAGAVTAGGDYIANSVKTGWL